MDNSAFRSLLSTPRPAREDDGPAESQESKAAKAARAAKAAERKAAYERRMALEAKRKERLAEESRYVDRAAQRRKELAKAGEMEEAPPLAGIDGLIGSDTLQLRRVPDGPTFAQVAGEQQEDLEQQQHRLSIAQSKYLGGDIEHTHLVKGLDFALLQKRRAELEATEAAARARPQESSAAHVGASLLKRAGTSEKASTALSSVPASKVAGDAVATAGAEPPMSSVEAGEMARAVRRLALSNAISRPNKALTSGRLLYVYSLNHRSADVPNSLVRAEDDLTIPRRREKLANAGMPAMLVSKLSKVLAYCARPSGERARKSKKDRPSFEPTPGIHMRPLVLPAKEGEGPRGASPREASSAVSALVQRPSVDACKSNDACTATPAAASTGKVAAPKPSKVEDDVDDIFGDGVGSDYVCEPSQQQALEAERERRLAAQSKSVNGGSRADVSSIVDAMSDEEPTGDGVEASLLLKSVLTRSGSQRGGVEDEEGDEAKEASAGESLGRTKSEAPGRESSKEKGMSMSTVVDDSYAECFPDSFERYNMELGPDSDDEAGIVRSKSKGEEEEAKDTGGKAGKKRGHDREKIEARKAEARMDRDLVQIEKLMEERAQKKARGESLALGPPDGRSKGGGGTAATSTKTSCSNESRSIF